MPPRRAARQKRPESASLHKLFGLELVSIRSVAALLILPPKVFEPEQRVRPARRKAAAGNTQNGKKLFTSYGCFECHGTKRKGPRSVARA